MHPSFEMRPLPFVYRNGCNEIPASNVLMKIAVCKCIFSENSPPRFHVPNSCVKKSQQLDGKAHSYSNSRLS